MDIEQILDKIRKTIDSTQGNMEKALKEAHNKAVHSSVYGAYTPVNNYYGRRMDGGGFSDMGNFNVSVSGGGNGYEMNLVNNTVGRFNGRRLDDIILYATGYHWINVPPRDFISATVDEMGTKHVDIVREALESAGFDVG